MINRREFSKQILTGIGGALLSPVIGSGAAAPMPVPRKPNIVFILSDQHGFKYSGFMGHTVVRTPNLDRIAQRGVVFRHAYCGNPVCAPSRGGMISGVFGSDVNSFCNATTWDGSLPAWPALLRQAGYETFGTGKMDADERFDMGFARTPDLFNEHIKGPDTTAFFRRPLCGRMNERSQIDGAARTAAHADLKFTSNAIDFLRQPKTGPWALYCGYRMPHPPFVGLQDLYADYLPQVTLPEIPSDHLETLHPVFQQLRHFKNIATPISADRQRRARAAYYAMITELDAEIGRIWTALEQTGELVNTVFVYSSDHGESLGEHGLWLKNNLYDDAARIPLVLAGPGIPAGRVLDTPVAHADLIRTFLELGGAKLHDKLRGHSLVPLMRGEPGDHPGWAYCESHSEGNYTGSFMIRRGPWKYIHVTWDDGLLFNIEQDPGEFHNRINDPAAASVRDELKAILQQTVDPIAVTERAFVAQKKRLDQLVRELTPDQLLDQFRGRLGEGQSVALLTGYLGKTFAYTHKARSRTVD